MEQLPDGAFAVEEETAPDYSREASEGMLSIVARLPEKYREALELADLKGMSKKQLSEHLDISYSGANSRVQRGRELVKQMATSCCEIQSDRYGRIINYRVVLDKPRLARKSKPRSAECD